LDIFHHQILSVLSQKDIQFVSFISSSLMTDSSSSATLPDPPSKRLTRLVVDTAAFIKKIRLETLADEFYTIPEVLAEVRDSAARQFFETLLIEVKKREPSSEAIRHGKSQDSPTKLKPAKI
jgi:hypothetical protein